MLIVGNKTKVKDHMMLCRVADESVVVIKFQPVKACKGVEEKTGMTLYLVIVGCRGRQKHLHLRRDEV